MLVCFFIALWAKWLRLLIVGSNWPGASRHPRGLPLNLHQSNQKEGGISTWLYWITICGRYTYWEALFYTTVSRENGRWEVNALFCNVTVPPASFIITDQVVGVWISDVFSVLLCSPPTPFSLSLLVRTTRNWWSSFVHSGNIYWVCTICSGMCFGS